MPGSSGSSNQRWLRSLKCFLVWSLPAMSVFPRSGAEAASAGPGLSTSAPGGAAPRAGGGRGGAFLDGVTDQVECGYRLAEHEGDEGDEVQARDGLRQAFVVAGE